MPQPDYTIARVRERVQGIFFCKSSASFEECQRLVEELGCRVTVKSGQRLTIEASRGRLQQLKTLHTTGNSDIAEISERLKNHFDRILIGGTRAKNN